MIFLKNIAKKYGGKTIFKDLNFTFGSGIYQIIGQNGLGKSVLLRLIAGIESPNEGSIENSEKNLPILYLTDTGIGLPFISIADNIRLSAKLLGVQIENDQYFSLFEGDQSLLLKEYQLSSLGNQMKVGLALLFSNEKYGLIILDESLSGIDVQSQAIILNRLKELSADTVILLVSHAALLEDDLTTKLTISQLEEKQND